MRVKLLTKAILAKLPALYAQEGKGDEAIVHVKFFTPDANMTWYATEGSPVDENGYYDTDKPKVDFVFFGLVYGDEPELGYFSLSELMKVRGGLGLPIERDRFFVPKSLAEVRRRHHQ